LGVTGVRTAAIDKRVRALATTYAVVAPEKAIFSEASPRFKQMFMYMAGLSGEDEFDAMTERMDTTGYAEGSLAPHCSQWENTIPCHLEAAVDFFDELTCQKSSGYLRTSSQNSLRGIGA
jgi:hypothetical protein